MKNIEKKIFACEDALRHHKALVMEHGAEQREDASRKLNELRQKYQIERSADAEFSLNAMQLDLIEHQKENERRKKIQAMVKDVWCRQAEMNQQKKVLMNQGYLY